MRRRCGHIIGVSTASSEDDAVGTGVGEEFIERKRPDLAGAADRYVTELDVVDRPFVHISRIVRDLGGWHEFTHVVERPSAERRLSPVRQCHLSVGRWSKAVHQLHHLDTSRSVL